MNRLQAQIIENTNELPGTLLQELVDFSEFLKHKAQRQAYEKRIKQAEKDIKEGNVAAVSPTELFEELEIGGRSFNGEIL